MSESEFQESTEKRLGLIEQNQARTNTYFKILGGVLVLGTIPIFVVAFDMRSAVSLLMAQSESQTSALTKLGEKLDSITIHGSPRTVDKIEVNAGRILENTNTIKDIDLRVRSLERGTLKQVSSNTNIVNLDNSETYHKPRLSTRELAELEGVNQDTVRRRIAAGEYQAVKVGSEYVINNPYFDMPTVRAMPEKGPKRASNGHEYKVSQ